MRMLRLLTLVAGLALAAALLAPAAALATETETRHFSGSGSEELLNPCSGATGTLTFEFAGVVHQTTLDSGIDHSGSTSTGTWTFVPDDPSQPSYTGTSTSFFQQNFINVITQGHTLTDSFSVVLHGSDRSLIKLRTLFHITANADGTVTTVVDVNEVTCL
jgi:hypothetical protein